MVLALFLSQFREMHPMLRLLLCGAIAGAPCLLILMQPDLGEVIIWAPVLAGVAVRRWTSVALFHLHHSHCDRLYSDSDQSWA